MNAFTTVSLVIVYVSAFVPWLFVVLYQRLTGGAWRRERMGWHVMVLTAVDGLIFTMAAAANIWPALALQPWYQWAYIGAVAGIPAVTVWRSWLLWRLYHPKPDGSLMPDRLKAALSTGVHALVALLISVLVAHGIDMPAGWSAILEAAILAATVAAYVALTHWLSTRPKSTTWGRYAGWIAKILTLGAGSLAPATSRVDPAVAALRALKTTL